MESYRFLFDVAIILLATKFFGLLTKKFRMPQVVGALLAGIVLGPAMLGFMHETDFITQLSEIGVIVLMFTAGMEADIDELKKTGKASFIIALFGVLVPLGGGLLVAHFFCQPGVLVSPEETNILLKNIFIGVILTATSVSITVETLKEMGKLNSRAGTAILGAAIIDDILGIIALTVVTSMADTSVSISVVLLKIVGFFVMAIVAGIAFYWAYKKWTDKQSDKRRYVIVAFVFCLLMSYAAEHFFGVADITGAFIAGLIISKIEKSHYITNRFETLSYTLLSPVFFASIGLKVAMDNLSMMTVVFIVILSIVAVLTKIVGCGIGSKLCKFTNSECLQVGTGMVSRGEVSLIVASKGVEVGLLSTALLGPIVLVVVVATVVSPILLKLSFKDKKEEVVEVKETKEIENK